MARASPSANRTCHGRRCRRSITASFPAAGGPKRIAARHWCRSRRNYTEELGLKLGDRLGFDVAGEAIEAEVLSFREVEWDSSRPNFFLVFSPGTLDGLAGTWLTSVDYDMDQRKMLVDLVRRFRPCRSSTSTRY